MLNFIADSCGNLLEINPITQSLMDENPSLFKVIEVSDIGEDSVSDFIATHYWDGTKVIARPTVEEPSEELPEEVAEANEEAETLDDHIVDKVEEMEALKSAFLSAYLSDDTELMNNIKKQYKELTGSDVE